MTETADFALRLKDQVSRDANLAAGAMARVTAGFNQAKRAADAFNPNTHWNKQRAQLDRVAKLQDELHMGARRREFEQQRAAERAARVLARRDAAKAKKRKKEEEAAEAFRTERRFEAQGFGGANLTGLGAGIAAATALATAGLAAAYAVGRIAFEFGAAAVSAAAFAQDSKLAIGALLGSAATAEQQFREVRFEAQTLGLEVRGTVDQFRKLLSAQFDVGTARNIVRMSADLQVAGANVEKAILAISQIKMKGFLQGEELTGQLAEAGVSAELVYKRLEKQLGKTRKEILTMQKTGKIQADVAIEAIFGAVKDKTGVANFGDLAKERAETTLAGVASVAQARIANFFIGVGEAITPIITPVFKRVTGLFESLLANRKLALFGDRALEALTRMGAWTDANWPRIEAFIVGGFESAVFGAEKLFDAGEFLVEHWGTIATAFEGGAFWLKMFAVSAALVAAPLIVVSGLAFGAAAAVVYLTGQLIKATETAEGFVRVFSGVAAFTGLGVTGGVTSLAGRAIGDEISAGLGIGPKRGGSGEAPVVPALQNNFASPRVSSDNIQGAMGRTTNVGGITMPINVAGIDIGSDPEGAGNSIGTQVQRALNNFFENLE